MKRNLRQLVFAAAMMLTTSASAQVYAEQMLTIGRNVLSMDDYVLAIQYFNHAAAAKPYLWDPYYYRALAKLMLDDFSGAEIDASSAIDRNKFKYEAYRVRGFARMRLNKDSAAIEDFNRGLEYAPSDKYFLYYKGIAQASMENYSAADSTLSELLRLYPRFEDGYSSRAQAHLLDSDTTAALKDIDRALQINANMVQPRLLKAEIEVRRGQWQSASTQLDTIISLSPSEVSHYINRAYVRYNADNWAGAMADYNYALELDPDNYPALYNRALLRFQVKDLQGANADFTKVLVREPDDFPARYNRGLVSLELGRFKQALADFQMIATRYPRFYPIYYAMSQAYQGMGNSKAAADNFFKANDMVNRYVANPRGYKLDRPTIQQGTAREHVQADPDDEEQVMEHFNELLTLSSQDRATPLFGEKLKGRVQDVEMKVQPEKPFALSFFDPTDELHSRSESYAELNEINNAAWIADKLFLVGGGTTPDDPESLQWLFAKAEDIANLLPIHSRPIDLLAHAVACTSLRNYDQALSDINMALEQNPEFVSALLQRAFILLEMPVSTKEGISAEAEERNKIEHAIADYDNALRIDPRLGHAWMGKGCAYYAAGDPATAADCFAKAAELMPSLGQAYYNHALCMMRLGRRQQAIADLSRAGELGVVAAYNLLKRI